MGGEDAQRWAGIERGIHTTRAVFTNSAMFRAESTNRARRSSGGELEQAPDLTPIHSMPRLGLRLFRLPRFLRHGSEWNAGHLQAVPWRTGRRADRTGFIRPANACEIHCEWPLFRRECPEESPLLAVATKKILPATKKRLASGRKRG